MDEQGAQAIIEEAKARKGLITVLIRHLEQSDDPGVRAAAAELAHDQSWESFLLWYKQREQGRFARKWGG